MNRTVTLWGILIACMAVICAGGITWYHYSHHASTVSSPNVLLIIIDALRADHLGCYGYYRDTSPQMDALAAEGVCFNNAFANSSWTMPSIPSLLTGALPHLHRSGARRGEFVRWNDKSGRDDIELLRDDMVTLTDILSSRGYMTACITANPKMAELGAFGWRYGEVDAAFSPGRYRNAEEITDSAIKWLEKHGDRPFFLLVHYMDVHEPLDVPITYSMKPYQGSLTNKEWVRQIEYYDYSVRYTDDQLGKIFDTLQKPGIGEETLVIVTADHGEELFDHYEINVSREDLAGDTRHHGMHHGHSMYEELLQVPLIMKMTTLFEKGERVEPAVRLIDLPSTVLDLLVIEEPLAVESEGMSMRPVMTGEEEAHRDVVSEYTIFGREKKSLRVYPWKLILTPGTDEAELYRLDTDPDETENLYGAHPAIAAQLQKRLDRVVARDDAERNNAAERGGVPMRQDDIREKLRAIGYL